MLLFLEVLLEKNHLEGESKMLVIVILMIIGAIIGPTVGIPPAKGAIIVLICLLAIFICMRDNTSDDVKKRLKQRKKIIEARPNRQSKYGFETPYYMSRAEVAKKKERAQLTEREEARKEKRLIKKANKLSQIIMDILEDLFVTSIMSDGDSFPERFNCCWIVGAYRVKHGTGSSGLVIRCQEDEHGKFYLSMKNDRGDCINTNQVKAVLEKHTGLKVVVVRE